MRDIEKLPGNARIAVALLDVLATAGDVAGRERVERALGDVGALGRRRADWIQSELLRKVFRETPVDERLARRVGHALAAPRQIGLLLFHAGVATPEKAYRRVDQLLARERPGDHFEAASIEKGRARIEFHPERQSEVETVFCAVRAGMLESMPTHFGLPPAAVREVACAHRGASCCVFEAEWRLSSRLGLAIGALLGTAAGAALGLALGVAAGTAAWLALPIALVLGVLGAAAGRSVDLARQLEGMARGRLGQLALVDQIDLVVAEKMDALAKLAAAGEAAADARIVRRERSHPSTGEAPAGSPPRELLRRLQRALTTLYQSLAELRTDVSERAAPPIDASASAGQELHRIAVELSEAAEHAGAEPEPADLVEVVRRAVAAARAILPVSLEIELRLRADPAPIRCHPFQLEQAILQLLLNAARASGGEGRVDVALGPSPDGFELAIRDEGEGVDPAVLDRVFDPFSTAPASSADSDLGLGACQRVVQSHGGELSVQSEPAGGTRIAVLLPADRAGRE
jgi:signal transduction histidine kinase